MAPDEFNLLNGAMPLLDLADRQLTAAELLALKPILDHILSSMVSGKQSDYDIFMDWMPWVAQHPDQKIAYMPFFVRDEGTGKAVILSKLLLPLLFGKCGLHCEYCHFAAGTTHLNATHKLFAACTNFDSVTCKFNDAIEFKILIFVDEGKLTCACLGMLLLDAYVHHSSSVLAFQS